jgi:hypothetical protein
MPDQPTSTSAPRALTWVYHALAIVALMTVIFLLNDLRVSFRRTGETVNRHLPEILEKTQTSTDTLAQLSQDIRELRDLSGATGSRDKSLVRYADELLDRIEAINAIIGTPAMIGGGLASTMPAAQWTADARKEALYLTFAAKSREELLERLTRDKFRRDWMIQFPGGGAPIKLIDWVSSRGATTGAATPAAP